MTTAMLAELVARRLSMKTADVRKVLDDLDFVMDMGLQAGHEIEVGSLGYLSLREPVKTKPPKGEVTRGRRVAFREKSANRDRWK
jgi:nucleoid DNA-binding protein